MTLNLTMILKIIGWLLAIWLVATLIQDLFINIPRFMRGEVPGAGKVFNYQLGKYKTRYFRTISFTILARLVAIYAIVTLVLFPTHHLNRPIAKASSDPLGVLGPDNPALQTCLNQVDSKDSLGIRNSDPEKDKQRQACIDKYHTPK